MLLGSDEDYEPNKVRIRVASPADLDSVVGVLLAAMPSDPQWQYRYPHRHSFREAHYHFTRVTYAAILDRVASPDWLVMVVEVPFRPLNSKTTHGTLGRLPFRRMQKHQDGDDDGPNFKGPAVITSVAVWNVSSLNRKTMGDAYRSKSKAMDAAKKQCLNRPDADPDRHAAFSRGSAEARAIIDAQYGSRSGQLHLRNLATHPDFQRRGHATRLIQWGMRTAETEGLVVTLFGGPHGFKLYCQLGFLPLDSVSVQVPWEGAVSVTIQPMVFDPKTWSGYIKVPNQPREGTDPVSILAGST